MILRPIDAPPGSGADASRDLFRAFRGTFIFFGVVCVSGGIAGGLGGSLIAGLVAGGLVGDVVCGFGAFLGAVLGVYVGLFIGIAVHDIGRGFADVLVRNVRARWPSRAAWTRSLFRWTRQAATGDGLGIRPRVHTTVAPMVGYLVASAVRRLPEVFRNRFAEEWLDHRSHLHGWRQLWWALCVRATVTRTAAALVEHVQLPRAES